MNQADARRTKIVCTLGPTSSTPELVGALIDAGMDVARLNFSHGDHGFFTDLIQTIRQCAEERQKHIAILQDLQGPKIRTGRFENDAVVLEPGATFTLTTQSLLGTAARASVSYAEFCNDVSAGEEILLDDGRLRLRVTAVNAPDVVCEVVTGGTISNHKGINLPGAVLSVPALSEKDLADLAFGAAAGVDWVAMSFVQRAADIVQLRAALDQHNSSSRVIAKIEKPQAVADIDAIIEQVDGIMIARGDLGVEVPAEEVPIIQKALIKKCNAVGTPVITATQMLESMITNPQPTRAEASDVANAVLDGTDAVMLSGETANGAHPVAAVTTMARIAQLTESQGISHQPGQRRDDLAAQRFGPALAIGYSACHSAEMLGARAIICLTQSGSTAGIISRFRPSVPIFALSAQQATCRQLTLLWGVTSMQTSDFAANLDETIAAIEHILLAQGKVAVGDLVVLTTGLPFSDRRSTNTLRIEQIGLASSSYL